MERAGYVRRVADPRDRRRLLIEPTAKTAERDREVFGKLARLTLESLDAATTGRPARPRSRGR